jgi:hypothetical protein
MHIHSSRIAGSDGASLDGANGIVFLGTCILTSIVAGLIYIPTDRV